MVTDKSQIRFIDLTPAKDTDRSKPVGRWESLIDGRFISLEEQEAICRKIDLIYQTEEFRDGTWVDGVIDGMRFTFQDLEDHVRNMEFPSLAVESLNSIEALPLHETDELCKIWCETLRLEGMTQRATIDEIRSYIRLGDVINRMIERYHG
jgi:hypothetical protein